MKNHKLIISVAALALIPTSLYAKKMPSTQPVIKCGITRTCIAIQPNPDIKLGMIPTTKQPIQIALLLDTSNSMDGLINQTRNQLWQVINSLSDKSESIQVALYEYGNSNIPMSEQYVRQVVPFTSDLDLLSEKLFSLKTNGGTEMTAAAFKATLNELEWKKDDSVIKNIFIAGNESFTQGQLDPYTILDLLTEKDIKVNTIFCGDNNQGKHLGWEKGAITGKGNYMSIEQDRQARHIPTPYDQRIQKLNKELNKTYVPYGSTGEAKKLRQTSNDLAAESSSVSGFLDRVSTKSTKTYNNTSWDFVDLYKKDKDKALALTEKELPTEYKGLTKEERIQKVEKEVKIRQNLQKEIKELGQNRNEFVENEKKKQNIKPSGLQKAITESINQQIKK